MSLLLLHLAQALAADPAADPVVMRLYAVERGVADPFKGKAPPEAVRIGECSGGPAEAHWEQACARVEAPSAAEIEATIDATRPWFAKIKVEKDQAWAFALPTAGGGNDDNAVNVLLLRGPPVEIRRSDLAVVKSEDRWVSLEWSSAGMTRLAPLTATLPGEVAFVIDGDRLVTNTTFPAGSTLVGTASEPSTYLSLVATWGDEALGARVVKALQAGQ